MEGNQQAALDREDLSIIQEYKEKLIWKKYTETEVETIKEDLLKRIDYKKLKAGEFEKPARKRKQQISDLGILQVMTVLSIQGQYSFLHVLRVTRWHEEFWLVQKKGRLVGHLSRSSGLVLVFLKDYCLLDKVWLAAGNGDSVYLVNVKNFQCFQVRSFGLDIQKIQITVYKSYAILFQEKGIKLAKLSSDYQALTVFEKEYFPQASAFALKHLREQTYFGQFSSRQRNTFSYMIGIIDFERETEKEIDFGCQDFYYLHRQRMLSHVLLFKCKQEWVAADLNTHLIFWVTEDNNAATLLFLNEVLEIEEVSNAVIDYKRICLL